MRKLLSVLALFGTVLFNSQAMATPLPRPEIEILPNGMQVAWFLNDSLPVVDIALLVQSGHRDDPFGKTGTSELLGAVLDRGAAGMNAQQIAHAIEMLGASRSISADEDSFGVGMHGLAPDAGALLDLLGKIVTRPEFPEAEVTREHARILDRWDHIGEYGETLASLAFSRILTGGTSYGRGNFLSVKEFKTVSRADVVAFYKKHFTPKNTVLMVVGRVKKDEFRAKIIEAFGSWQGEKPQHDYRKFRDTRLAVQKGQIVVVDRPDLTQAQVRIGFPAPLITAPEHYSLVVGNALLGEYFNSRLNSVLRDQLGLTYGISSSFSYSRDFASFNIGSATRNETTGQLVSKTISILKELRKGPIPDSEVEMAKEYLIGGFPLRTETLGAVASRWLAGYVFGLGPDYLNEFIPKVAAVRSADVQRAVAQDLHVEDAVIVVAGDAKAIIKSLGAAGLKSIRRASVNDLM